MTYGSSHPDNSDEVAINITCEPGGAFLVLTAKEHLAFKAGEVIQKITESAHGRFLIAVRMERIGPCTG